MTLSRGEGENLRNISQRMDFRHNVRDFIRQEGIRQDRLKANQAQDLRIRDLQANFKVYTKEIAVLMSEIKTLPDDVKKSFRKAKREYKELKRDFSDVFIFTSSDQLTMRPTYYLNPRLPDLEQSARNANEDRLRDAINQISPFHQELSRRVQTEKFKVARDQLQVQTEKLKVARDQLQQETTESQVLAQQNESLTQRNESLTRDVENLTKQKEIQESRPQDEKELKELQSTIDRQAEKCILFFERYDREVNEILEQLPGAREHLVLQKIRLGLESEKDKGLGLNAQERSQTLEWERSKRIMDVPIPDMIKHLEYDIKLLSEEDRQYQNEETTDEDIAKANKDRIASKLKLLNKYKIYLVSLQETFQQQYKDIEKTVEKYKGKRKELKNLQNLQDLQSELVKKYQGYLTFLNKWPLSPETKDFLWGLAVERYKAGLDPKVVSPLILSMSNKLVEQADKTIFNGTIKEVQEQQKCVAEDLGLDNFLPNSPFFLNSQMYETDYYQQHTELVLLRQQGEDCGQVCVQMVAADKDNHYSEKTLRDGRNELVSLAATDEENASEAAKILHAFDRLPPPEGIPAREGMTWTMMFPIVLRKIEHPIKYEIFWNEHTFHLLNPSSPLYQEYSSSIGSSPQNITVDQFKSALSQNGEIGPIIVKISRDRTNMNPESIKYERNHFIVVDATVIIDGEKRVICRDPAFGKGYCVSVDDIVEVWGAEAVMPDYQQRFEEMNTSLRTCFKDLSGISSRYTVLQRKANDLSSLDPTDSRFPAIEELLEVHQSIRALPENLERLAQIYRIPGGDFRTFAAGQVRSIKEMLNMMKITGSPNEKVQPMQETLETHKKTHSDIFGGKSPLGNLLIFKEITGILSDTVFETSRSKIKWDISHIGKGAFLKWIEKQSPSSALSSRVRGTSDYSTLKAAFSELQQVYEQMQSGHHTNDQEMADEKARLLQHAAIVHKDFLQKYREFQEKHIKNLHPDIMTEWIQEGKGVFKRVESKSAERRDRGMTGPVIEQRWRIFYKHDVKQLKLDAWKPDHFDSLMKAGLLKGQEEDYYLITMSPRIPNGPQFRGVSVPLMVCVNPKEGVVLFSQADREAEKEWKERNLSEERLEDIKQNLAIENVSKEFFEPLYASDLSAVAYQLAVEAYEGKISYYGEEDTQQARPLLSENDLSHFPLKELVGGGIEQPETNAKLLRYDKKGEMMFFSPGEEGFDLVLSTHFGRRMPFMQADYPQIVGDGKISRVGIYRDRDSGKLAVKLFIDTENDIGP